MGCTLYTGSVRHDADTHLIAEKEYLAELEAGYHIDGDLSRARDKFVQRANHTCAGANCELRRGPLRGEHVVYLATKLAVKTGVELRFVYATGEAVQRMFASWGGCGCGSGQQCLFKPGTIAKVTIEVDVVTGGSPLSTRNPL